MCWCFEDEDIPLISEKCFSLFSALKWVENVLDYLEQQDRFLPSDRLVLESLRNAVRKEEATSVKQKFN
jgi:hypothetical protein